MPWLVLETTGSPARAGFVAAVEFIPIALFGIPSGQIASRLGARRTMLVCDLARLPLVAAVPLLHSLDALSYGILLAIAFGLGAFFPAHFASQRAILPELLGEDSGELTRGNVMLQAANRLPLVIGPAVGGSLIALIGASNVLIIDACSYAVSASLLAFGVPRQAAPPVPEPEHGGVWAGAAHMFGDPVLRPMTVAFATQELAMQGLLLSLPILAFTEYGERAGIAGLLLAAWGFGALAGTIPALRVAHRPPIPVIRASILIQALPLWLMALPLPAVALTVPLAISGLANPVANAPANTLVTLRTAVGLRAKALLAFLTACMTAGGVGLIVTGPAAQAFGVRTVLLCVAALATLCGVGFWLATRRTAGVDDHR